MNDLSYDQLKGIDDLCHILEMLELITPVGAIVIRLYCREKATLEAREQIAQDLRDEVAAFERAYA